MQIWHNKCKVGREHLVTDRREHAGTEGPVKTWLGVRTICAAALALNAAYASADPTVTDPLAMTTRAAPTTAAPSTTAAAPSAALSAPTTLVPRGLSSTDLPAYDDFMHRAVAQKRLELVRFVDRDDRRVFLGLSRDGYLGIQIQTRDRR